LTRIPLRQVFLGDDRGTLYGFAPGGAAIPAVDFTQNEINYFFASLQGCGCKYSVKKIRESPSPGFNRFVQADQRSRKVLEQDVGL
jgi:hypothetical protein